MKNRGGRQLQGEKGERKPRRVAKKRVFTLRERQGGKWDTGGRKGAYFESTRQGKKWPVRKKKKEACCTSSRKGTWNEEKKTRLWDEGERRKKNSDEPVG